VFLELKRQGYEIFYHQKKTECDFVIRENNKIQQAIQVTAYLDNIETKKRELNGLIQAMKEYDLKTGLILTLDTESEEQIEDFVIKIMPVWKWLVL
jgi:predicted AAA+ superfamily ATPase